MSTGLTTPNFLKDDWRPVTTLKIVINELKRFVGTLYPRSSTRSILYTNSDNSTKTVELPDDEINNSQSSVFVSRKRKY